MLLTNEERMRFITWLEAEIQAEKMILDQMEKLLGMENLIKHRKMYSVACALLLKRLKDTHLETIG